MPRKAVAPSEPSRWPLQLDRERGRSGAQLEVTGDLTSQPEAAIPPVRDRRGPRHWHPSFAFGDTTQIFPKSAQFVAGQTQRPPLQV
jgi:hypothetical protein